MQYLNLPIAAFASPEFVGEEPVNRATWLTLLAYCCAVENGGTINDCAEWGDRRWQQTCKVTRAEVESPNALLVWSGRNLVVAHYPAAKQVEIQAKRQAGIERAALRWANPKQATQQAHSSATSSADSSATSSPHGEVSKGSKVKEVREVSNREEPQPTPDTPPVTPPVKRAAVAAPASDEQWLAGLVADPTYAGIDVTREFGKMRAWCSANRKQPTRKRFTNWLNRVDRPLPVLEGVANASSRPERVQSPIATGCF